MLPIWNSPVEAGLFMLAIQWGAILYIRVIWEGHFYWTRWWSFKVGDILLALYGVGAAILIQDKDVTGLQGNFYWHVTLLIVGLVISIAIETRSAPGREAAISWLPSQIWHTAMFAVLFYLVLWSGILIITKFHSDPWVVTFCVLCIAGYVATVAFDNSPWQDPSPEMLINGIRR
ncbi:MAG: hypothetical protein A3C30_04340 [Candidatus Levybacteria bacterium RIFCSPHIGHO2_02_FULL_40_18]|nr:MAG: hypothetical protein A2869_01670 [Candidatus Levybacteria bacterium RIFCSPHIGHO2_01_FULL_40_58]OGH26310.1 MAG: hypothetical protein A3C30_04340 [Candidatus Levybacteria bacterium RIFCSPHIGHO2_02_FULL_40_18]OGH31269.1 MAG: hypothetical protein A3E43_02595 [Candidatus Levybacteria bacterium RIFCSPHIGHO2_12_FULL_40_31]OGH40339.1 MAG: hypothetical protein A2894_05305 [Candidatus Levybacteria bacterium RIFCSPLOWO2_01_FULL_40_64]OGH49233.1 MAG: hypothetical protein A3I54_01135 [Candidatus Lev